MDALNMGVLNMDALNMDQAPPIGRGGSR